MKLVTLASKIGFREPGLQHQRSDIEDLDFSIKDRRNKNWDRRPGLWHRRSGHRSDRVKIGLSPHLDVYIYIYIYI